MWSQILKKRARGKMVNVEIECSKRAKRERERTILETNAYRSSNELVDWGTVFKDDTRGDRLLPRRRRERRGNRDKVPSSRPVTSTNDIQIPLGQRRDVRLTTFGLQIGALSSLSREEDDSCRDNGDERKRKNTVRGATTTSQPLWRNDQIANADRVFKSVHLSIWNIVFQATLPSDFESNRLLILANLFLESRRRFQHRRVFKNRGNQVPWRVWRKTRFLRTVRFHSHLLSGIDNFSFELTAMQNRLRDRQFEVMVKMFFEKAETRYIFQRSNGISFMLKFHVLLVTLSTYFDTPSKIRCRESSLGVNDLTNLSSLTVHREIKNAAVLAFSIYTHATRQLPTRNVREGNSG